MVVLPPVVIESNFQFELITMVFPSAQDANAITAANANTMVRIIENSGKKERRSTFYTKKLPESVKRSQKESALEKQSGRWEKGLLSPGSASYAIS